LGRDLGESNIATSRQTKRLRFGLCAAVLVAVAGGLGFAHGPILRWAACALIVEREELTPDAIWLGGGDRRLQTAADLYHENPRRSILITRGVRDRVIQIGVLPPLEEVARKHLMDRGVPSEAIEFFGDACRDRWETARALQRWLERNPEKRVLLLCGRFRSRQCLDILRQVLEPQEVARIDIRGLPNYRCDETNWWKSRTGVKQFINAWLGLLCTWTSGEPVEKPVPWDPETYEELVEAMIAGETG
jgi:hypothetical protein